VKANFNGTTNYAREMLRFAPMDIGLLVGAKKEPKLLPPDTVFLVQNILAKMSAAGTPIRTLLQGELTALSYTDSWVWGQFRGRKGRGEEGIKLCPILLDGDGARCQR